MLPLIPALVNVLGCAQPSLARPDAPAPREDRLYHPVTPEFTVKNGLGEAIARGHLPEPDWAPSFAGLSLPPEPPASDDLDLEPLGAPIKNASMDLDAGAELTAYVDENIPLSRWNRYGISALTFEEVWGADGTGGVCEEGALLASFEEDGVQYEASYSAGRYGHFVGNITPLTETMSSGCEASLLDAGGDIKAALDDRCDEYEEHTFFPEGSDCRACLESGGGDYAACVDDGACLEEAVTTSWTEIDGEKVWARTALGYAWACAPDIPAVTYLMADISDDGALPEPWDHAAWLYFCTAYWDDQAGEPAFGCQSGDGGAALGDAVGAGVVGRVNHIRPEGEEGAPYYNRLYYSAKASVLGVGSITRFWASVPGAGQISVERTEDTSFRGDFADEPVGQQGIVGWGLNPYELRPDGADPSVLDDTLARDWLATLTLKTATTIDGILINTYNHNRCLQWEGPNDDGVSRCVAMAPPDFAWDEDARSHWWQRLDTPGDWSNGPSQVLAYPYATIGSTGLPDPGVPGGNVVEIAGSPVLADPDWDACAWPDQFVPDIAPYEAMPVDYGGDAWLWGQTYRFGKDPDLDLRVVLNTNDTRGFCPEGG